MSTAPSENFRTRIIEKAKSLGFDLVGFSPAKIETHYIEMFEKWLKKGNEGSMEYMKKIAQRKDLTTLLPDAKSVIVLGVNYYYEQSELKPGHGRVARYAYGRDYHKIIKKKLKELEVFIIGLKMPREKSSSSATQQITTRSYVDTGPVLERALAEQSGIGFAAKNSCIITKEFGSWVFLSEIITNLELSHSKEAGKNVASKTPTPKSLCGRCTKCIDACPTGAIIAPGVIDSRLCISYLTIENKEKIPANLAKIIKKTRLLYGCDICQEVCPHNIAKQKAINTAPSGAFQPNLIQHALQNPKIAGDQLSLKAINSLNTDEQFLKTFAGSPLMRAKRKGLQRSAKLLVPHRSNV